MPLKAPTRLPASLRRRATPLTRKLARKYTGGSERALRRRRERRLRFFRRVSRIGSVFLSEFRIWLIIGISIFVIMTATILLVAPIFDVRQIRIRRQDPRIDIAETEQALAPLFRQRLVLVTKGQVSAMLSAEFPDIERVEVQKNYPSALDISIFLEPVVASVKIDDLQVSPKTQSGRELTSSGSSGFSYLTRNGYFVSSPIKLNPGIPIENLHVTDWGIRPQNRTELISPAFLKTIFSARDMLRSDFGLSAKDITIFLRAKEFHIRTEKVALWFDLTSPLSVQFQRFRELLKNLPLDQVKEYIDLRIADKIVYK